MVAAVTAAECGNARAFTKSPSSHLEKNYISTTAAAAGRRARSKEVTSRYLSSSLLSSAKSNCSTISTISSFSSSSSSSSSPSFTPRRFPSPLHNPLPKTPSTLLQRRSQSVDRKRPSPAIAGSDSVPAVAAREALRTTTRSLSVSFQGESFFFQTSKAKPLPRKPAPECRKSNGIENSQPDEQQLRRWPTARARESNFVSRNSNCSVDREDPMLVTVRLLQRSLMLDDAVYFNNGDRSQSLDSDNLSSGSSSSLPEPKVRAKARGICVPARFRQESGWPRPHAETPQKMVTGKQQSLSNTQLASPRFLPYPQCGPKSFSAKQAGASRARSNITESHSNVPIGNAPSIISFASEVRRAKKSESRIEDAHMLRLFHNRYLQWRYVNAREENALSTQLVNTKINLYNAWISISELHDSAMNKQIKLQVQMQNLKVATILKEQTQDTFMATLAPTRPFITAPVPRGIKRRKFRGSRHSPPRGDDVNDGPHGYQGITRNTGVSLGSPVSSADLDRDLDLGDPGPQKNTRPPEPSTAECISAVPASATPQASLNTEQHSQYRHYQGGETPNPRAAWFKAAHATLVTDMADGSDYALTDAASLLTKTIFVLQGWGRSVIPGGEDRPR